ncbi:MAG: exodeoxyribonuclease VII small subunit [Deltaproteobacteria bacterium]|nr:exodeoxyribonuclease VII small subunit [Deltaproteobacteria bacterium]
MSEKKPKFEEALLKLEEIVKKMEAGDLPLDQSLKVFEEGMGLVQFCEKSLNEAEAKVEKLMKTSSGEKARIPFEEES